LAGLADRSQLVAAAGDDRLHQPYRTQLFPAAPALLEGLRAAGALTSFWSGAGPTILAVCDETSAGEVARAATEVMGRAGLTGQVLRLAADSVGITLSRAAAQ